MHALRHGSSKSSSSIMPSTSLTLPTDDDADSVDGVDVSRSDSENSAAVLAGVKYVVIVDISNTRAKFRFFFGKSVDTSGYQVSQESHAESTATKQSRGGSPINESLITLCRPAMIHQMSDVGDARSGTERLQLVAFKFGAPKSRRAVAQCTKKKENEKRARFTVNPPEAPAASSP